MRSLSLVQRPLPVDPSSASFEASPSARAEAVATAGALALLRAAVGPGREPGPRSGASALAFVCDFATALTELATGLRSRKVVRVASAPLPLELGLERVGPSVLATLFAAGPAPSVVVHERRAPLAGLIAATVGVLRDVEAATTGFADVAADARVTCAIEQLADLGRGLEQADAGDAAPSSRSRAGSSSREPEIVSVDPTGDLPVLLAADLALRPPAEPASSPSSVLRAELLPLLFKGKLRIALGDVHRELPDVFVFLVADQLTALMLEGLDAWTRRQNLNRRVTAGGALCGLRIDERSASLTLGVAGAKPDARAQPFTFPIVDVSALAQAVVAFGRALTRSLVRRDRSQAQNLRVVEFKAQVRELAERLRDHTRDEVIINTAPESYRAFAIAHANARGAATVDPAASIVNARLGYSAKWFATVPSIDLRATFLCGDGIVLGSTRELAYLDRRTGEILWKRPVARAATVMTPLGVVRIENDGTTCLHGLSGGDVTWRVSLAPRVASTSTSLVVSSPGLPRMLLVSEGARHLAALDLDSGDVRWRFPTRAASAFRLRRAGKLAIVASGGAALSAVDVASGDVVWRFCDPLRFTGAFSVDHDALFALAGDGVLLGRGGSRLHHLDPYSGAHRWMRPLPTGASAVGAPLLARDTVVVVTHGPRGTSLIGLARATGDVVFERIACSGAASCLVVDDTIVVNSESGEFVGVDARDGSVRFRHALGSPDADRPRRLDPVLRSGALFVPQQDVHVVRPRDGVVLGKVEAGIVPDLLRVDEKCDVYVAEESGHLAAFSAAPRLALVRPVT